MSNPTLMVEHPGWCPVEGRHVRAVRVNDAVWTITCTPAAAGGHAVVVDRIRGASPDRPVLDLVDPAVLHSDDPVAGALRAAGAVMRLRNPDIWDALATSIVRQVIRAGQARKLYRVFCENYGERIATPAGEALLFPTPEAVLDVPATEFTRLGLAFKRPALLAAAERFLEVGPTWAALPPKEFLDEVQTVRRVGPWTARATVADLTNDYALYPIADLAVRTHAERLDPTHEWPRDEPEFDREWRRLAGEQLSEWTLLTLAWGVRHGTGAAI